eukprot:TRINITY_DN7781_c0_g1_i1.p1 TRINITY_DN7781_c0_g1~~TRINITY_DN7781_c0_g1_i1.p1  ORF type:complete len:204 (+),score=65.51 TRINITY_DN7781_c0_g1_i1:906-1517(+)
MMEDARKKAVTKKDKRRAEKKEERDKWQQEMAMQDDARMVKCKKLYHRSLKENLPVEPSCIYPVYVDARDGVFVPVEPVADVTMPDCPASGQAKVHVYTEAVLRGAASGMTLLAHEISSIQRMHPTPTSLDAQLLTARAKYHAIVAAIALLTTSTEAPPQGFGVRVSGVSPQTSQEAVEMAFFAFGNLLRCIPHTTRPTSSTT